MGTDDRSQSTAEREADQRARIVAAATETYAARGYEAATVQDICVRAKMSRRTVYVHFRTLDDIRFAVLEEALQATLVEVACEMERPSADRLAAVLQLLFSRIVTVPGLARVVLFELRRPEPRNMEMRQRVLSWFVQGWLDAHAHDQARGQATYSVDVPTLYALLGAIEGMVAWYLETHQEAKALEAVPVLLSVARGVYPFQVQPTSHRSPRRKPPRF